MRLVNRLSRRDFFKIGIGCGIGLILGAFGIKNLLYEAPRPIDYPLATKEATYYRKIGDDRVQCEVCFRRCIILEGERGFCTNRQNVGGRLYSLVYGRPCAIQIDPIEKEPQYHNLPGSSILCLGTAGCNFKCIFCHNWHMSTRTIDETGFEDLPPERAVEIAQTRGVEGVSFTYNEPTVFYEYMYDVARLAKKAGLRTLFHTNGSMNPEPLKELLKQIHAVTVDLKGFTPQFYKLISSSEIEKVKETLKLIHGEGVWLEIVNLMIPTLNDDMKHVREMCMWIKENLGEEVPLHFSRFFPAYLLTNVPPTPIETLEKAAKVASDVGLEYVTIGNVPGHKANSTFCPRCGERLVHRIHFKVQENSIREGRCRFCGHNIPGLWS